VLTAVLLSTAAWAETVPAPSIESLLATAARARRAGEMVRAAALYQQILIRVPVHRLAAYNAGIILENADRPALAAGVWRGALAADPGDLFAYEHLCRNLARAGGLEEELAALEIRVGRNDAAQVPRLQQSLALSAAGRGSEAAMTLENFLLDVPASNIAYNFLKDAFTSTAEFRAYVQGVGGRARLEGAPEFLRLLYVRLLLERGQGAAAVAFAAGEAWEEETSRRLLRQAGVLAAGSLAAGTPRAEDGTGEPPVATGETLAVKQDPVAGEEIGDATPGASAGPAPVPLLPDRDEPAAELPDFGPRDPRSAPRYEQEGMAALTIRDHAVALAALRRSVEAAPLRLQPRILLALLLEQSAHPGAARAVLRGPVEPSPWDVYQQGWRAVRDDYIDPDYGGVDIFRLRAEARRSIRTLDDAKAALAELLAGLGDRYAYLFDPERFAGYLLTPNAGAGTPQLKTAWIPVIDPGGEGPPPGRRAPGTRDAAASERPAPAPGQKMTDSATGGDVVAQDVSSRRAPANLHRLQVRPPETDPGAKPAHGSRVVADAPAAGGSAPGWRRDPGPSTRRFPGRIGYLAIPSLAALDLPQRIDLALVELAGSRHLVIDLRGNRGGDGEVAVEVASLFLAPGTEVCTYETRRGREVRRSLGTSLFLPQGSLVVLVDDVTASAAELLAVALHETGGAMLVGERTAGKGVGQRALLLPDGSGMSLTRFRLLAPSGASWNGRGLKPSLALATASPLLLEEGRPDGALEAALAILRSR